VQSFAELYEIMCGVYATIADQPYNPGW
jgi:hypothetical protein